MAVASPQVRQSEKEQIMKIKLEISELVASCLQRMIVNEIENQEKWYQDDLGNGYFGTVKMRKRIIHEMHELADDIEKQGVHKHIKCY